MSKAQPPVRGGSLRVTALRGRTGLAVLLCVAGLLALSGAGVQAAPAPASNGVDAVQQEAAGGQYIVDFAYQYLGSPYVYAGNTPSGFDCSGFTQFVVLNTVGIDIGHDTAGQTGYGAWVDWGMWAPGDLVYFQGTYRAGISHTGIYVGDGEFIHAENESTGVTVSSLFSDYYSSHYYGATRVW